MKRFYELKRYAQTGIASPGMRAFDKMFALSAFGGGVFPESTISGAQPISFKSDGSALTAWVVSGASGGVGDETANLWDEGYTDISTSVIYFPLYVGDGYFTLSTTMPRYLNAAGLFLLPGQQSGGGSTSTNGVWEGQPRTFQSQNGYITIAYKYFQASGVYISPADYETMLNAGSTAMDYEPYGKYKIPITCGGQTYNIYLDSPLDAGDSVSMEDTGITITPAKGANTLAIGTTLPPSEVSITGHIKAV